MMADQSHSGKLITIHYYTREELKLLADTVCVELKLNSLKKALEYFQYDCSIIYDYIHSISKGEHPYAITLSENITEGQKKWHQQLFHAMFKLPTEDLPLYLNGDTDIKKVALWRLRIVK